jgi:hypothetical protein
VLPALFVLDKVSSTSIPSRRGRRRELARVYSKKKPIFLYNLLRNHPRIEVDFRVHASYSSNKNSFLNVY